MTTLTQKPTFIKRREGVIVSTKMAGVAVVRVSSSKQNPKYHKRFVVDKGYKALNPGQAFAAGERVVIEETRPLSRSTRWRIVSRVKA